MGAPAITVWRFDDAPDHMRALSDHGGDEDWLAVIPREMCYPTWPPLTDWDLPGWMWEGTRFGVCSVSVHVLDDNTAVAIGAHA